jgi:hypothetical protein
MGIFKSIKKIVKKAAPLIGATIGMYIGGPMGSAALGGALGGGIGSLVGGGDTDDALKAALFGGIGGYASAGGNFTTAGQTASNAGNVASTVASDPTVTNVSTASANTGVSDFAANPSITAYTPSSTDGLGSFFDKFIPESTLGKLALGSTALGFLTPEEEQAKRQERGYTGGEYRGGTLMTEGDDGKMVYYDGGDEEERKEYYNQLRRNEARKTRKYNAGSIKDKVFTAAGGGEVNGPGTGTSDSVPARLSDGEFVVTADAVRGAGGGDRNVGAARMYDMMSQLERAA